MQHSYKKRKDSLETRAKLAVRRAFVEHQTILEPILLYRGSEYKQSKPNINIFELPFYLHM